MNQDICALKKAHDEELKTADDARKDEIYQQWAQIFAAMSALSGVYDSITEVAFKAGIAADRRKTPF